MRNPQHLHHIVSLLADKCAKTAEITRCAFTTIDHGTFKCPLSLSASVTAMKLIRKLSTTWHMLRIAWQLMAILTLTLLTILTIDGGSIHCRGIVDIFR